MGSGEPSGPVRVRPGPRPRRPARLAALARAGCASARPGRVTGRRVLQAVADHEPALTCTALGAQWAATGPGATAMLAMGDGSARRSTAAPGYLDDRAVPFDTAVEDAVRAGDLAALAGVDPALARDLMATGRPAWQVLAGALARLSARPPTSSTPTPRSGWPTWWRCSCRRLGLAGPQRDEQAFRVRGERVPVVDRAGQEPFTALDPVYPADTRSSGPVGVTARKFTCRYAVLDRSRPVLARRPISSSNTRPSTPPCAAPPAPR